MSLEVNTSPARLRELATRLWTTATSDDRVSAHHLLLAIAAEKEAVPVYVQPTSGIYPTSISYSPWVNFKTPAPVDVPPPEPMYYAGTKPVAYTEQQMRDYAKAVRSAERSRIVESINAEIDLEALRDGESYYQGMDRAAEIAAQEGTK